MLLRLPTANVLKFPMCPDWHPSGRSKRRILIRRLRGTLALWLCSRDPALAPPFTRYLTCCFRKLLLFNCLIDDDCQIAAGCVDDCCQTLRRGVDEEEQLREDLFLARHGGQSLHFLDVDDLAVNDSKLEGELGVVRNPGRERLCQSDRVATGVGDRGDAFEPLEGGFDLRAGCGALGELVLENAIASARCANGLAQLVILRDGEF